MTTRALHIAQALLVGVALAGCASGPGTAVARLTYDAEVLRPGKEPRFYKQGQLLDVGDEPMWIRGNGYAHVVVIPAMKKDADPVELFSIRADALAENSGGRACLGQKFQESLGEVLAEVNVAQVLLRAGRREEAFATVEKLADRYPGVKYLQLLRASVLTALGRRGEAEEALAKFLKVFPDDSQALALQQTLERVHGGSERANRMIASEKKKPAPKPKPSPAPEPPPVREPEAAPMTEPEPAREPQAEAEPEPTPEVKYEDPLLDIKLDAMRNGPR
jgi:tetratricopeptide (TPR) repeat protein